MYSIAFIKDSRREEIIHLADMGISISNPNGSRLFPLAAVLSRPLEGNKYENVEAIARRYCVTSGARTAAMMQQVFKKSTSHFRN
jgi:hypothetical protein